MLSAQVLSDSEACRIHELSLKILAEVGVDVCHETIRAQLLRAGALEGATNARVRLPAGLVTEALAHCPTEFVLHSVRGDTYRMAAGNRFYSSCVVDPFMLDYRAGRRPPVLADCATNARLVDALDVIAMPYKMDLDYGDAVGRTVLLDSNLAFMSNMSKHYVCAPHDAEAARIWMDMSEIMAQASLWEKPIVSALISPTSPLTFDSQFLDLVAILLPYGIPLILLPCPQAGATSPFTLAGTVVGFNAENLAAITLIQTLRPGTPLHYHTVAMGFDMRSGRASLGGPEKALCGLAAVDMGRFYNLSCGCAGTATNSVHYDFQNGAETMAQLLPAVASRANLITGIGSIGNGMGTSAEQILFDCDLIALATYLHAGIRVDDERLAFDAFERVGPGGDFLQDPTTLQFLRSGEHFYAGSFETSGAQEPARSMYENLHARVEYILARHRPVIPEARIEALRRYTEANR
ncbi:MAG: trimethylamine methyltransferase family protein [Chloroflexi bacterium]|nr:trimethylamine methyltransferase family protein [Chloroflexota bacterium]